MNQALTIERPSGTYTAQTETTPDGRTLIWVGLNGRRELAIAKQIAPHGWGFATSARLLGKKGDLFVPCPEAETFLPASVQTPLEPRRSFAHGIQVEITMGGPGYKVTQDGLNTGLYAATREEAEAKAEALEAKGPRGKAQSYGGDWYSSRNGAGAQELDNQ